MRRNVLLWIVQGLLAALFLFAGGTKLVLPPEALAAGPIALPIAFLRFIGLGEVLGAIGLILPGLFRIHRELTPVAAAGLVIIMIGATVLSALAGGATAAVLPFITGVFAVLVAIGRVHWIPVLHFQSTSA